MFDIVLCWCQWTTDGSALGVKGLGSSGEGLGGVVWHCGCIYFRWVLYVKKFSDFGTCSINFRPAWEKTTALLTCGRWVHCGAFWPAFTYMYCEVSGWNIRVCPHIILYAALFHLLCIHESELSGVTRSVNLTFCWSTYVRDFFFLGRLAMNILDVIFWLLICHLCRFLLIAETANYMFCRSWIFRYLFGQFFDIRTSNSAYFRDFVWCHTINCSDIYIFFFGGGGVSWWIIRIFLWPQVNALAEV
jgi:hypothetical protein